MSTEDGEHVARDGHAMYFDGHCSSQSVLPKIGLENPVRKLKVRSQEGAARYAGAEPGACPTERAGGEHVTGRGWHGADARVWPRGLRGARERWAPGRGGDDGRDGGGCMHPDAGRPCCGPERRTDPSAGQVCAAARRF